MSRNEPYYPPVPPAPQNWERIWAERIASAVNMLAGKTNCAMDLTLDAGATETTLTDFRVHPGSVIGFMPTTANAATAKPSIWVDQIGKGTAVIHHASSANVDQTFRISIIG